MNEVAGHIVVITKNWRSQPLRKACRHEYTIFPGEEKCVWCANERGVLSTSGAKPKCVHHSQSISTTMSTEHRPSEPRSRQLQRKTPNTEVYIGRKQCISSLLISLRVRKGQITNVLVKGNTNPDSSGYLASVNSRPAGHAQRPEKGVGLELSYQGCMWCRWRMWVRLCFAQSLQPGSQSPCSVLGQVLLSHPLGAPPWSDDVRSSVIASDESRLQVSLCRIADQLLPPARNWLMA